MKFSTNEVTDPGLDIEGAVAHTIEFNKDVADLLSKGIYSDETRAVIRETITNAWDAGKGAPFEIEGPMDGSGTFKVTDFGPGLSDTDVMELASTYFSSRARGDEEKIGNYGLGFKSPFSVTNEYVVQSRFNGKISTFLLFKKEGLPQTVKQACEDYDGPTGLTVIVPTGGDFKEWRTQELVETVLATLPIVGGEVAVSGCGYRFDERMEEIKKAVVYEDEGILAVSKDFPTHSHRVTVLIGGVQYPVTLLRLIEDRVIELSSEPVPEWVEGKMTDREYRLHLKRAVIELKKSSTGIIIKATADEAAPEMSRESLSMSESAKKILVDRAAEGIIRFVNHGLKSIEPIESTAIFDRLWKAYETHVKHVVYPYELDSVSLSCNAALSVGLVASIYGVMVHGRGLRIAYAGCLLDVDQHSMRLSGSLKEAVEAMRVVEDVIVVYGNVSGNGFYAMSRDLNEVYKGKRKTLLAAVSPRLLPDLDHTGELPCRLTETRVDLSDGEWHEVEFCGRTVRMKVLKRAKAVTFLSGKKREKVFARAPRPVRHPAWRSEDEETPTIAQLQAPFDKADGKIYIAVEAGGFSKHWEGRLALASNLSNHVASAFLADHEDIGWEEAIRRDFARVRFVGVTAGTYRKVGVDTRKRVEELHKFLGEHAFEHYKLAVPDTVLKNVVDMHHTVGRGGFAPQSTSDLAEVSIAGRAVWYAVEQSIRGEDVWRMLPKRSLLHRVLKEASAMQSSVSTNLLLDVCAREVTDNTRRESAVLKKGLQKMMESPPKAVARAAARYVVVHRPDRTDNMVWRGGNTAELEELIF